MYIYLKFWLNQFVKCTYSRKFIFNTFNYRQNSYESFISYSRLSWHSRTVVSSILINNYSNGKQSVLRLGVLCVSCRM